MQIIPVIDIKGGQVVLAKQGQRDQYRPLHTPLCHSSQLDDVINAYLSLYNFTQFYIADLDALMLTGSNHALINSIFSRYPYLNFMVDSGTVKTNYTPVQPKQLTLIIGTESIKMHDLADLKQEFILSLDFSTEHRQIGETTLFTCSELWPKQLIIMTLGLVGKNSGPDLEKLEHYQKSYPQHKFVAAGGIRHLQDLIQLKQIGIETALVASALHNGSLTGTDIQKLESLHNQSS